jgi:acyl-CoA synthetase (AMP-forming)/AMP-acid ligase II
MMKRKSAKSPYFKHKFYSFLGGGNITEGYYKLPGKTDEEYFTDPSGRRWFRSGDIGQIGMGGLTVAWSRLSFQPHWQKNRETENLRHLQKPLRFLLRKAFMENS